MLRVDVYGWTNLYNDKTSKRVLDMWFTLKDGETVVKMHFPVGGNKYFKNNEARLIEEQGVPGRGGKLVRLEEGVAFLEALQWEYRGPHSETVGPYKILTEEQETPSRHVWEWSYRSYKKCVGGVGTVPMELWQACKNCSRERLVYTRKIQRLVKLGTDHEKHELLQEYLSIKT